MKSPVPASIPLISRQALISGAIQYTVFSFSESIVGQVGLLAQDSLGKNFWFGQMLHALSHLTGAFLAARFPGLMSKPGKKHWSDVKLKKDEMRPPENPTRLQIARALQDQAIREKMISQPPEVVFNSNGRRGRALKVTKENPFTKGLVRPDE